MTGNMARAGGWGQLPARLWIHAGFWLAYYLLFSVIWASPERGYFASFYLEFVLMPLRILASYCMMYVLIPGFFRDRRLGIFAGSYLLLILIAGGVQLLITHFFYDRLLPELGEQSPISIGAWMRSVVLINTTVIFLGAAKVIQLHFELVDSLSQDQNSDSTENSLDDDATIEVRSNRRMHRLRTGDILFVEAMGNYIRYAMIDGSRITVYSSLKASEEHLPDSFVRLHRSYLANRQHISAYDNDSVTVGSEHLPRAKDVLDEALKWD